MASERYLTTDHDRIRRRADDREGTPSAVNKLLRRETAEGRDDAEWV